MLVELTEKEIAIIKEHTEVLDEAIKKEFQPYVERIVAFCDENGIDYDFGKNKGKSSRFNYVGLKQFKDHIEMFYKGQRIAYFSMRPDKSSMKRAGTYKTAFTCNNYVPFIHSDVTRCVFGLNNEGTHTITDIDQWEKEMKQTIINIDKFASTSAKVKSLLKFWEAGEE